MTKPPSTTAARPVVALKPTMLGLVDRSGAPDASATGYIRAFVIQINWADLQPTAAAFDTSSIDGALAQAKMGDRVKLRVYAGDGSPSWAKTLDGPAVTLHDQASGRTAAVPRFWGPRFADAYARLQVLLAGRYDADPRLVEVAAAQCTTIYAEPFIRQLDEVANRQALLQAGYTTALDEACQASQIRAHLVWSSTRTGLALNPFQRLQPTGQANTDLDLTNAFMDRCRAALGVRCVLENNSVTWPVRSGDYPALYRLMLAHGGPITVQTATSDRIGSWQDAVRWSADYLGASAVELPRGYELYSRDDLAAAGAALARNEG